MENTKELSGLKVADFSQGVAGPYSAMMLAQAGASVTKVEPIEGDWARTLGAAFGDYCAHAITVNLGKKSISLDLKSEGGLKIAHQIAAEADVVIESFRPGVMSKFGLDYASVSKSNENVIYLSVTGYGQEGPYNDRPVTDGAIQGFSGWMNITKDEKGTPMKTGMVAIDFMTGLFSYQSILKALIGRGLNGKGRYIDSNLMQTAAAFQTAKILEHHLEEGEPSVLYVPAGNMKTADGFISIAVMREHHYSALCKVMKREDLIDHSDYNSRENRVVHEQALMQIIRREFLKRTTEDWAKSLNEGGVIQSPINTYADYLINEQTTAVDSFAWVDHDIVGKIPLPRIPGFDAFETGSPLAHSPQIGEHSNEVLENLHYSEDDISALRKNGAVRFGR